MYQQASQPMFLEKSVSIVSAIIVIINMVVVHGISNFYVVELLTYLSIVLMSGGNHLPNTHYEAKKLIHKMGMNYKIIHACPNRCILFRGQYKDLWHCLIPTYRSHATFRG